MEIFKDFLLGLLGGAMSSFLIIWGTQRKKKKGTD